MDAINHQLSRVFADQTSVLLLVGLFLLAMADAGFRISRRQRLAPDEPRLKNIETVQASILGLMGFLLGFTFSMALQRYDHRQKLVQDEANAIGTAFLRAAFLPDAARTDAEGLFRRYVTLRLERNAAAMTEEGLARHEGALARLQQQLWQSAVVAARANPVATLNSYAGALNEMFDLDASRLAATRNHVPGAVWLLLLLLAAMGCGCTGYRTGTTARRSLLPQFALPLLIAVVIMLIADLDRPRHGLIGLDERSLRELQSAMDAVPAPPRTGP